MELINLIRKNPEDKYFRPMGMLDNGRWIDVGIFPVALDYFQDKNWVDGVHSISLVAYNIAIVRYKGRGETDDIFKGDFNF